LKSSGIVVNLAPIYYSVLTGTAVSLIDPNLVGSRVVSHYLACHSLILKVSPLEVT
jgi:hypothetical protein